jgi:hypothetical protein
VIVATLDDEETVAAFGREIGIVQGRPSGHARAAQGW